MGMKEEIPPLVLFVIFGIVGIGLVMTAFDWFNERKRKKIERL